MRMMQTGGGLPNGLPVRAASPPEPSKGKMIQPGGWLNFSHGWLSSEQLLQNLEAVVSLLQTVDAGLAEISENLNDIITLLYGSWKKGAYQSPPSAELRQALQEKLKQIDEAASRCQFHGRGLLDGQSGVVGVGEHIRFIKGGAHTRSSPSGGYPVHISATPIRATMLGGVALQEDWLRAEEEIFLADEDRFVRYTPQKTETVASFLSNLQQAIYQAGLDLEVGVTWQQILMIRHQQYGTRYRFKGLSKTTPLLSKRPNKLGWSNPGRDIKGDIAGEKALGVGRMLVGDKENPQTAELTLLWDGKEANPSQVPRCYVQQNGILFQEQNNPKQAWQRLCLPSFRLKNLGRWLDVHSHYQSMADLRVKTWNELVDTLQVLFSVSCELEEWREQLKAWIEDYQNKTMACLHTTMGSSSLESPSLQVEQMTRLMREVLGCPGDEAKEVKGQG